MSGQVVFLRQFLGNPTGVAALAPSSPHLAAAMLDGVAPTPGGLILEFGPGTGSFTSALEPLLARGMRYLGVEADSTFHGYLRGRFPHLDFVHARAEEAEDIVARRGLGPADLIVSGLPLAGMKPALQERVIATTRALMAPGARFRMFTYIHFYAAPRSVSMRRTLRTTFPEYRRSRAILRNLPPAFVLEGRTAP